MSARPSRRLGDGPRLGAATRAVLRLAWRRLVRARKMRLSAVATLLVVGTALAARYAAPHANPADVVKAAIRIGFLGMLVYLLPFLLNSGAIAEDVEARTFTYLAVRPAGRVAIALGKYLAGAGASVLLLTAGILVLHVGAYASEPRSLVDELPSTLRVTGAISLLALCYSGICLFWGSLIVQAGGLVSTLHLAALEFGVSWLPSFVRFGSMNYLASQFAGLPKGGFFPEWVPDLGPSVCGLVVAIVTFVYVGLATWVIRVSEFGTARG